MSSVKLSKDNNGKAPLPAANLFPHEIMLAASLTTADRRWYVVTTWTQRPIALRWLPSEVGKEPVEFEQVFGKERRPCHATSVSSVNDLVGYDLFFKIFPQILENKAVQLSRCTLTKSSCSERGKTQKANKHHRHKRFYINTFITLSKLQPIGKLRQYVN